MSNIFEQVKWLDNQSFMFANGEIKSRVVPGEIVGRMIGFSEAACHTGIAGKKLNVKIIDQYCGQIVHEDGRPDGAPYLLCELGFYSDIKGYFH